MQKVKIYIIISVETKGQCPKEVKPKMIFTPISHLRGMLQHRASIPNNPYHDQHILEFTGYMEETVEIL